MPALWDRLDSGTSKALFNIKMLVNRVWQRAGPGRLARV